jgi:ATP-dependent Clp protease ATP-binding subunit ClpC
VDPAESRFIHKYFEPADRFLRVRIQDSLDPRFHVAEGIDGEAYRRMVVEACIEGMGELEAEFAGEEGESDERLLDRLFGLALAVNPELDIHQISLRESSEVAREAPAKQDKRGGERRRIRRRARGIEDRLARRIVGQKRAIAAVGRAVRHAAAGLSGDRGPLARLLFVGPTGSGKTEMARALAEELDAGPLVRIDCAGLAQGHEYAKLVGAPPGYVGHEDGGLLTEAVRKRPDSVVLFDEVEKAHPHLHHLLLGLLEEGELTDGRGRRVDFRRAVVLFTSNAGVRQLERAANTVGFQRRRPPAREAAEAIARGALEEAFRPEFLARLDEVLLFDELEERELVKIAQLEVGRLAVRVRRRGGRISFSSAVPRWLARAGAEEREGARGILHVLRREIEAPLAELLLSGSGGWIRASIRDGRPRLRRED